MSLRAYALVFTILLAPLVYASDLNGSDHHVYRTRFVRGQEALKVEVLKDDLFHFEWGSTQQIDAQSPIPTTPQIIQQVFPGTRTAHFSNQSIQTGQAGLYFDSTSSCFSFSNHHQIILARICPKIFPDQRIELQIAPLQMQNVYGLGEKFRKPGQPNGDWAGDIRYPGVDDGNMMTGFDGNYTADMEIPVAYMVGPDHLNYAIFLDEVRSQIWDFQKDPWKVYTKGPSLRFFLISAPDLPGLRKKFMDLVGHPPIPPKKAFGLWVSQYGYKDWSEVDARLEILRAHHFPVDGFVMDLDWFGGIKSESPETHMGKLTWDRVHFPDPEVKIKKYSNEQGVGLILIEEPYIGEGLSEFQTLKNIQALALDRQTGLPALYSSWMGKVGMMDWSHDETSALWHDWKRQPLIDMGIVGHWTDLGEPAELATGMKYHGIRGMDGDDASHMHNLFNFKWHESIANGYERHGVRRRPFMLSRTGTTGIQRFGTALWSGDIRSRLTSLAAHLNAQMHLSLSGIDYFGADIGGFYRPPTEDASPDRYTRWFAHGAAFDVPVRPHTAKFNDSYKTSPAEEGDISSNLANLRQRYELIPYYYTLAYRAWKYGEAVMPPLVYYIQEDQQARTIGNQKLIGRDLMIVASPTDADETRVYLPKGEWIDYIDHHRYISKSGHWLDHVPLHRNGLFRLPTYVRSGAILPQLHIDDSTWNALGFRADGSTARDLQVQVFPSIQPTQFTIYEDDGETTDYKKGAYTLTSVAQRQSASSIDLTIKSRLGPNGTKTSRRISLKVSAQTSLPANPRVTLNGHLLPYVTPGSSQQGWNLDERSEIQIMLWQHHHQERIQISTAARAETWNEPDLQRR